MMSRFFTLLFTLLIVLGAYTGVRYLSSIVHYNCAVEQEDCPPPFRVLAEFGWYATGGSLVPFWTRA
jgi:hypothetical protein